ncbi:MAG: hypothetical protein ABI481_04805 [Pyrinomonadaceae bacterium]
MPALLRVRRILRVGDEEVVSFEVSFDGQSVLTVSGIWKSDAMLVTRIL